MDQLYESRLVCLAVTFSAALAQVYFIMRARRADKIYLLTRARSAPAPINVDQNALASGSWPGCECFGRRSFSCHSQEQEVLLQSKSNLRQLDGPLKFWSALVLALNAALVLKYFLLCLLDTKSLRSYRFLDCYLLGRAAINGRIVGMTKYNVLFLTLFQLLWRATMLLVRPHFDFAHLEFLLRDPNSLVAWEVERERHSQASGARSRYSARAELQYSTLLDYKNPFISESGGLIGVRLRPNRTLAAWQSLARSLLIYLAATLGLAGLAAVPGARMSLAMMVTEAGFKLNYRYCVEWVREQPNKRDYEFIYAGISNESAPAPVKRAFMPFENFIELNVYQTARIAADFVESALLACESILSYVIYTVPALTLALDMRLYCRAINKRLDQMISWLRVVANRAQARSNNNNGARTPSPSSKFAPCPLSPWGDSFEAQALEMQALIRDFFAQVNERNSYAAFHTIFMLLAWFVYSIICASWLFIPHHLDQSGKLEWYLIQAILTTFILLTIGALDSVRRESVRLYQSIATLACLDRSHSDAGKDNRWTGLMKHYSPRPLSSFRTHASSEISWLLGVKMFAWLASVLFVLSGFFRR